MKVTDEKYNSQRSVPRKNEAKHEQEKKEIQ